MAHFAEINSDNVVVRVLKVPDEQQARGHDYLTTDIGLSGIWIQTSYNTRGGVHYATKDEQVCIGILGVYINTSGFPLSGVPGLSAFHTISTVISADGPGFRKNFAGVGYIYDSSRDAFVPPKPYPSWVLDEVTCWWGAPVAYPTDGNRYRWDEASTNWVTLSAN